MTSSWQIMNLTSGGEIVHSEPHIYKVSGHDLNPGLPTLLPAPFH